MKQYKVVTVIQSYSGEEMSLNGLLANGWLVEAVYPAGVSSAASIPSQNQSYSNVSAYAAWLVILSKVS